MQMGVFLANVVVVTRYCDKTMVREFEGEIKEAKTRSFSCNGPGIRLDTVRLLELLFKVK